jgi:hypothetical protein
MLVAWAVRVEVGVGRFTAYPTIQRPSRSLVNINIQLAVFSRFHSERDVLMVKEALQLLPSAGLDASVIGLLTAQSFKIIYDEAGNCRTKRGTVLCLLLYTCLAYSWT